MAQIDGSGDGVEAVPEISRRTGKPKKKPRGKPMVSGDERSSHSQRLMVEELRERGELPPIAPGTDQNLLAAMQWVVTNAPSPFDTELQRECRSWKKKSLAAFMGKLADLETAVLRGARAGETIGSDDNQQRIEGLLEKLIAEANCAPPAQLR
jgi:hypothetical protein